MRQRVIGWRREMEAVCMRLEEEGVVMEESVDSLDEGGGG